VNFCVFLPCCLKIWYKLFSSLVNSYWPILLTYNIHRMPSHPNPINTLSMAQNFTRSFIHENLFTSPTTVLLLYCFWIFSYGTHFLVEVWLTLHIWNFNRFYRLHPTRAKTRHLAQILTSANTTKPQKQHDNHTCNHQFPNLWMDAKPEDDVNSVYYPCL
jgi:hypothetical protein